MLSEEIIQFAAKNPVCFVATNEELQPHVRPLLLWFADQAGFYFHTSVSKQICRQLSKNPRVELCFFANQPSPPGTSLRVTGEAEFISDPALHARLLNDRPWLEAVGKEQTESLLAIFRLAHGTAYFWKMEDNLREHEITKVVF